MTMQYFLTVLSIISLFISNWFIVKVFSQFWVLMGRLKIIGPQRRPTTQHSLNSTSFFYNFHKKCNLISVLSRCLDCFSTYRQLHPKQKHRLLTWFYFADGGCQSHIKIVLSDNHKIRTTWNLYCQESNRVCIPNH